MKILIASEWYKPVVNGVVTSVLNLEEGLRADGHEVRVLTLSDSIHSHREGDTYYISAISANKVYPNAKITIPVKHELITELIEWKPDVIHTQAEFSTFFYARKISEATGAPIIHTYHTAYEDYTQYFCPSKELGRKIVRSLTRKVSGMTDEFIVPSSKMYDMVEDYNVRCDLHVIPTGIDLKEYLADNSAYRREIREKLGVPEDECLLVAIGRLAQEKNLQEIIGFLADKRLDGLRLLIVGDGPYRKNLEDEVARLGLSERVLWTGMISPTEIAHYYSVGDIFVCASTSETQGLTYMEAMASGLPILCRNDACLDDVVEIGKNGLLYEDQEEFVEYLGTLLDNPYLRERLGQAARKSMIEKFSIHAFASACEKVYEEAAEEEKETK